MRIGSKETDLYSLAGLGFCSFQMPIYSYRASIIGGSILSYDNGCWYIGSAIHGATVVNTIYQDGQSFSTFRAFNPTQPEETYSMVTANRFWSQIFGLAFSNKRWLHFFRFFSDIIHQLEKGLELSL